MAVKNKITAVITAFVLLFSSLSFTAMADETNTVTPIPTITPAPTDDINICLLYTSPSQRDRTRSRMPSSA